MADILQLKSIHKSYQLGTPIETEVLHGISFSLAQGSFTALTGPSGSGKSTLLNIIGLLESPTAGDLWINGQQANYHQDQQITRLRGDNIGFVFQFHHLISAFTALENVMMPSIIEGKMARKQAEARALSLLDAVGLAQAKDKKPSELSGGMQQRVAIARALMRQPPLVLADEPTGNLDTQTADEAFQLLRRINAEQGIAFLIVTHDQRLAQACDRTLTLVDGALLER